MFLGFVLGVSRSETKQWTSNGPFGATISAVVSHPIDPHTFYLSTSKGSVFRTTNGGDTWEARNSGLSGSQIETMVIDFSNPLILYVGTIS